ncbi:MAG: hypothetical protein M1834_008576 [Cirrosporium novae-zelandiae]|nr:MAG: hypothetical protein M1834_008576 [Cirrosporium novae-zelandiae]
MIDFTLSETQAGVRDAARAFATNVLSGARATYEEYSDYHKRFQSTRPIYREAVKSGLIKAQIPTALGGAGGSLVEAAILVEELYSVEPSVSLTILGTGLGLSPLIAGGSEEQRRKFLEPFLSGEGEPMASLVHSEPGGTANWLEKGGKGLQTTARKDGEDWIINGEKMWATNSAGWDDLGPDLQCVVCRNDSPDSIDSDPRKSILILLVTRSVIASNDSSAFQVLKHVETAGHTAVTGPQIRYTNFRVPRTNLLAAPGTNIGAELVETSFSASAALVGAMAVGIMRASFDAALTFSKIETRGGDVPILQRQSVADLLMDIKMRTEASRYLVWKALHCLHEGPGDHKHRLEYALEAKIFCSENAVKSVFDAMKAVGVTSYSLDQPFSRLMNDALVLPIFDGGNVGIRRRQLEKIFMAEDYQPWAASLG